MTLSTGQLLLSGNYRIEGLLARGGMGEVYRASNLNDGSQVALKIIRPELAADPTVLQLFFREAEILRRVRSDGVVGYAGLFRDQDQTFLAMDYVHGISLADRMRRRPLSVNEVRGLKRRLARALAAVHDAGTFHRDLSPDNILLPDDDLERATIIDFGIAKLAQSVSAVTVTGDFAGKYAYAAPEQLQGGNDATTFDGRSDIYSLGLVLAAAAIGRPLDMGRSLAEVVDSRRSIPDLSPLPEELRAEIGAMLDPDPNKRPQSMRDLLNSPRNAKAGRWIWPALAGGVAMLAVGFAIFWLFDEPEMRIGARSSAEREEAAPVPPTTAKVDLPDLQEAVNRIHCADITATARDGLVILSGVVSRPPDLQKLIDMARAHAGVTDVQTQGVQVRMQPLCEAETLATRMTARADLALTVNHQNGLYRKGEFLEATIRMPSASGGHLSGGHLYVDFFDQDGTVLHLLPNDLVGNPRRKAGETVELGTKGQRRRYQIGPPYGDALLLALVVRQPLFVAPRPQSEDARSYLDALEGALRRAASQPIGTVERITTRN